MFCTMQKVVFQELVAFHLEPPFYGLVDRYTIGIQFEQFLDSFRGNQAQGGTNK